jgi:hypothetical protein
VRLPIPPPPHCLTTYFFGAGAGAGWGGNCTGIVLFGPALVGAAAGALFPGPACAGAVFTAFCRSSTLPDVAAFRVAKIASDSDVIMKTTAEIVVAFDSTVADPRGPNAVCDPMPPNAPARSAAFPLCSNTTITKKKQTRM